MATPIPLVDLPLQHARVAAEVERGWRRVVEGAHFVLGEEVARFEASFARFCGAAHCVGVASGTDALELALRALGIGRGDEVIVPANTFVASAAAAVRAGARPVLVDVDPATFLVSPDLVAAGTGPRAKAVVAVHLYGQVAAVERLRSIVGDGVSVVEDAAQAHGAWRHGRRAGALGDVAATSFYPGKNLGAYGDGGAVLTSSDEFAARLRRLRNHGGERRYQHDEIGFNSRLDELQAVVLSAKLRYLDAWNDERRAAAARYSELLADLEEVVTPTTLEGNEHAWHLYVVRVPDRDRVLRALRTAGIGAGIHYPTPIHLQPAFRELGYRAGEFPVAEDAARHVLSLPIYPGITEAQQQRVVDELRGALR